MKQWVLFFLALSVSALCAIVAQQGSQVAHAQEGGTATPTATATLSLTPTTPVGTPTPAQTATVDLRVVNEIVQPQPGDAIAGVQPLVGTAIIDDFARYEVAISQANAESFEGLASSTDIVRGGTLYELDTRRFFDGLYDLRVRAIDADGNYTEAFVRDVEIRNVNPPSPTPTLTPTFALNEFGTPLPPAPPVDATPQPDSPLADSPLPTPTPNARGIPNNEAGQGLFSPQPGEVLRGDVSIVATVNGKRGTRFDRYDLGISPAGLESYTRLAHDIEQGWQIVLTTLDSTRLADGFYDLRLRIIYDDSNYDEFFVRDLRIANDRLPIFTEIVEPEIRRPSSDTLIQGQVDVVGTAVDPDFLRWELALRPSDEQPADSQLNNASRGPGTIPSDWTFLVSSGEPVVEGLLARLDLTRLTPGAYDLRLRVVRSDLNYNEVFARNLRLLEPVPPAVSTYEAPRYGD